MQFNSIIAKVFAISSLVAFTTVNAFAHSAHDHSKLHMKWEFAKDTKAKIERQLNSNRNSVAVGLTKTEQRAFDNYHIHLGNTFQAQVNGHTLTVKRTSLGIQIIDKASFSTAVNAPQIPLRATHGISKLSLGASHAGHNHANLSYEWVFSNKMGFKVAHKIDQGKFPVFVGLSAVERKVMETYDIQVGNIFQACVAGRDLTIKRTSGGLFIDQAKGLEVASLKSSAILNHQ